MKKIKKILRGSNSKVNVLEKSYQEAEVSNSASPPVSPVVQQRSVPFSEESDAHQKQNDTTKTNGNQDISFTEEISSTSEKYFTTGKTNGHESSQEELNQEKRQPLIAKSNPRKMIASAFLKSLSAETIEMLDNIHPTTVKQNLDRLKAGVALTAIFESKTQRELSLSLSSDERTLSVFYTTTVKRFLSTSTKKINETILLKDIVDIAPRTNESRVEISFSNGSSIIFLCEKNEECDYWVQTLGYLARNAHFEFIQDPVKLIILKQWSIADADGNGKLDFKEVIQLCNALNLKVKEKKLLPLFKEFDKNKKGYLDYEEFVDFYKHLMVRPEIDEIFKKYAPQNEIILPVEFQKFLKLEQGENISLEDCESLIQSLGGIKTSEGFALTSNLFTVYMNSPSNSIIENSLYVLHQDMNRPLCDYYISSSHNTYLTGHQLHGESSVEMYKTVLRTGCRCVELDIWDGANGEPIIYHGHTLTSKILFKDVIECINVCAFETSKYPVILSLENHCSFPQQVKMAQYMKEIFGSKLHVFDPNIEQLPSPEELKEKILIKGKKIPIKDNKQEVESDSDSGGEEDVEKITATTNNPNTPNSSSNNNPKKEKKVKVVKELSDITSLGSMKYKNFTLSLKKACYMMHSLSENKQLSVIKKEPDMFMKYNRRNFSRIYPKGVRFASSNYDPAPSWIFGCQLVALNFQTYDEHLRFNEVKFEENGKCGYILKPKILRTPSNFNPLDSVRPKYYLKIKIISSFMIPKVSESSKGDIIDPFVVVSTLGVPADVKDAKTHTITNNGFNPVWNSEMHFLLACPELAYLRIQIFDYNFTQNFLLAENHIPLDPDLVRTGYRSIPLRNKMTKLIDGCAVFAHIDYSPAEFVV